jgi:hypothetical protein
LAGTKADVPSTVFLVNIMSISSKYEGKPFLNFFKLEWHCNMNVLLLKCCMKVIVDNNFVGMNELTFVCFSHQASVAMTAPSSVRPKPELDRSVLQNFH